MFDVGTGIPKGPVRRSALSGFVWCVTRRARRIGSVSVSPSQLPRLVIERRTLGDAADRAMQQLVFSETFVEGGRLVR